MYRTVLRNGPWPVLLVVFIWGLNFTVVKAALRELSPFWFNALRFTLALGVLVGFWTRHRERDIVLKEASPFLWVRVGILGLVGHGIYQVFFIMGLDRSTAANAAIVLSGTPLWTASLAHLVGQERLRPQMLSGMLLAMAGVGLVVGFSGRQISVGPDVFLGNVMIVGCSWCWAFYTVFSRSLMRRVSPLTITVLSMAVALPVLWGAALLEGPPAWEQISLWAYLGVLYSGLLAIALSYVIWAASIRRIGAARTAVYGNLVPVVATAAGVILLHEKLHSYQMLGGAVVLLGLYLVQRRSWTRTSPL
nr:MAG: hypothetical protein KatS3mg041_1904 [Bacteroidota bacterium]